LAAAIRDGRPIELPLVAAYGTNRAESAAANPSAKRSTSRREGYQRALTAGADASSFTDWLRQRTGIGLQTGRPSSDVEAVTTALRRALPDYDGVRYDFTADELMATAMDGSESRFSELSSGQRALLGLFCDIAYRCAVLNPHLGPLACLETRGVVLIDEIDLHLHPEWQRDVVGSLLTAFPGLQIIATTHSPFVLQSLPTHAVIDLSDDDVLETPRGEDYRKQSIEDIAEGTMGVRNPQWSRARQRLAAAAERYYTLMTERNGTAENDPVIAEAKRELDEASIPFSEDTAFAIYRAMRNS
jgi:predicted ATP-binding protein involved in virulence